jgi:hypothetical protein
MLTVFVGNTADVVGFLFCFLENKEREKNK